MVQASQPETEDTTVDCPRCGGDPDGVCRHQKEPAPPEFVKMARNWLYDNDLPAEWEDAVALEFDAAIADRKIEIVRTHAEGRPAAMPVVDWLDQEAFAVASETVPAEDAAEAAASQERWR